MRIVNDRVKLLSLLCVVVWMGIGCASGGSHGVARGRSSRTAARGGGVDLQLSEGYGLLYALLSKQSRLDGILIVKSASKQTEQLLREIAAASGEGVSQLEAFAKTDERLLINWTGLREVEARVRDSIESAIGKQLLFAGDDFELRVLLTQAEALQYGAHLGRIIGGIDQDEQRSAWAQRLADQYDGLRDRVVASLKVAGR